MGRRATTLIDNVIYSIPYVLSCGIIIQLEFWVDRRIKPNNAKSVWTDLEGTDDLQLN